ncbi:hypothetical protein DFR70_104570 [Nocardia tenerifensis]|uniref:Uncharacterized protein n=1 Tax=Nocardia tenerifensis TaxID=228006 RepID=A0A318K7T1_9NOCA|nr:hypothetical protein [Nocardia tenerifensis]PXX65506.1 hypothetical protein DFR70_104570 [Nocardia tenerifensis]
MNQTVRIRRAADGLVIVAPDGAPTVLDAAAEIDVLVLEAAGGHLTWSLLAGQALPAAVLDDVPLAQDWLWAVFGEEVALAVDAGATAELTAAPGLPELVTSARRLGYAHWAARWWPASVLDGIAPLDERLLLDDIAALAEACEMLLDGADEAFDLAELESDRVPQAHGRAEDYALAAGPATTAPHDAMVLARGVGGWDWRRCPPRLLDASEQAVSWEVLRHNGITTISVRAVASPQAHFPPHLRPHALIRTAADSADVALTLAGDAWCAEAPAPDGAESAVHVAIYVPGVGVADDGLGGPEVRQRVRDLAARRLRRASDPADDSADAPLLAEIDAAAADSDF